MLEELSIGKKKLILAGIPVVLIFAISAAVASIPYTWDDGNGGGVENDKGGGVTITNGDQSVTVTGEEVEGGDCKFSDMNDAQGGSLEYHLREFINEWFKFDDTGDQVEGYVWPEGFDPAAMADGDELTHYTAHGWGTRNEDGKDVTWMVGLEMKRDGDTVTITPVLVIMCPNTGEELKRMKLGPPETVNV